VPINDYFNFAQENYPTNSKAFSATMRSLVASINAGFALLPPVSVFDVSYFRKATTTGTAGAYLAATVPPTTAYPDFMRVALRVHATNPGASTINIDGVGVRPIKRRDGMDLDPGDLQGIVELIYDAVESRFLLLSYVDDIIPPKLFSQTFTITSGTPPEIIFNYPSAYFVNQPKVLVTISDEATELSSVLHTITEVSGVGMVYTSVTLTFPLGYIGKHGSVVVMGD
jgi:hypothetical protein